MISLPRVPATALLFACLFLLGCEKDSPPSDKTEEKSPAQASSASDKREPLWRNVHYQRSCDGTTYCFIEGDKPRVLWLVNGKSVNVDCDIAFTDDIDFTDDLGVILYHSRADIHGGLYIAGKKHLWYVRDGKMSLVEETTIAKIKPEEHQVSHSSILWNVLGEYGLKQHDEGYKDGREEGHDEGYEEGREEGYREGREAGREADY